jgi:hypothetical protein
VKLGFYYAAFRYEMPSPKDASSIAKSETVRISFATPLPFYPYKEPDHPGAKRDRVLAVWLASPTRSVPVAAMTAAGTATWRRPWAERVKHRAQTTADLAAVVGPQLGALFGSSEPAKDDAGGARLWEVQTFEDQKTSRRGWGDVVLVPAAPRAADAGKVERMQKLTASLEPADGAR